MVREPCRVASPSPPLHNYSSEQPSKQAAASSPIMAAAMARRQQAHFLIVTYPSQGHVTPARHLARRLVHGAGARATVCVPVSAFRKMFPADDGEVVVEEEGGAVAYAAYSDGYDGGFDRAVDDHTRYMAQLSTVGARTVAGVLRRLRGEEARHVRRVHAAPAVGGRRRARPRRGRRRRVLDPADHRARRVLPLLPRRARRVVAAAASGTRPPR